MQLVYYIRDGYNKNHDLIEIVEMLISNGFKIVSLSFAPTNEFPVRHLIIIDKDEISDSDQELLHELQLNQFNR